MLIKRITLTTTIILSWLVSDAVAQEYRHVWSNNPENVIEIAISQGDIRIEGYSGDEVVIQNLRYAPPPERAEGLRSLYGSGVDNTGIGLSVEEEGNTLRVLSTQPRGGDFVLRVPDRNRVMIEEVNWIGGTIEVTNHGGDIEIAGKNSKMVLKDVTGPVTASTTSGSIDIEFSELSQDRPTSISNISGYIDITMPASTQARFMMSSMNGGIYTDLDLQISGGRDGMSRLGGGNRISGDLNGGGVEVELKAISGDIYLREK
jgi:hypothetical protein